MGSFANSLHLRSENASDVIAMIDNALRESGYETTEELPAGDAGWGMPSPVRAVHVSEARNGWVGVLDSDTMGCSALAAELSRRLETYSLFFLVNDSDSWHYQLFRRGAQLDEFDSSGGMAGDSEFDEWAPEPTAIPGRMPEMQHEIQKSLREMQKQMDANLPADMREIQQRMQHGAASQEERRSYAEWAMAESQRFMARMNEMMAELKSSMGIAPVPQADLNSHLEKLRPILPAGLTDDSLLEVLGKQAVFAEEILGEFMELIGVAPLFANLSYAYLAEFGETELLDHNIELVTHLRFKTNRTAR